ncbi:MAG: thiamine pyrophosphate-dependent enzyme [Methanomicrobiales archaeon]|nr:thiamine pyrophosphate-dependent enzyme [Methanomicrobiales archaeon]MDI6875249.1 thiamine pyrophosphate-dependent enzyme [Methanomicrobiales archaeon]
MTRQLITAAENTWCPGCGNFSIQHMMKSALLELNREGLAFENVVLVAGIGCHGKLVDYLDINSFYAIHGRPIPVASGIKIANPDLHVICFSGDGDAYAEGLDHLLFVAKRNLDITVIVHNNRVYGLTTGQYTPTSPEGFKGRSTPRGTIEKPLNPLELVLASGGTYIARGYTKKLQQLKELFKQAIRHRGFSLVDVLQVCATYYDIHDYYDRHVYDLTDHDPGSYSQAWQKVREWDYNADAPIALGTFYQAALPTFEERLLRPGGGTIDRVEKIRRILSRAV